MAYTIKLRKLMITTVAAVMFAMPFSTVALAETAPSGDSTTQAPAATDTTPLASPAPAVATPPAETTPTPAASPAATGPTPVTPTTPTATTAPTTPDTSNSGPKDTTGARPDWVFNTLTSKWETADQSSFNWDKNTGYWLSPKYVYDTRMGWYKIIAPLASGDSTPSYYLAAPTPPQIVSTPIGDFVVGSPEYQLAKSLGIIVDPNDPQISNTGPNSNNLGQLSNSTNALVDFTNIVRLANNLKSDATTGDANVSGNTNGGNAHTGTAAVMANVVNLLNSVWNTSAGPVVTFVKNIFGNVFGDMVLAPPASQSVAASGGSSSNTNTGPNSTNNAGITNTNDVTVHARNDGSIDNNIDLNAQSGAANVSGNTNAGDATTGDASVALNLINMINSAISSDGSFLGILNIYGNFNGDVLFAPDFLSQVLQSGGASTVGNDTTGPSSANTATTTNNNNLNLKTDSNTAITNDVTANAKSGSANVGGNTIAGSATTGDADTHSSVLNLSGQQVAGDNALLVIVNVLGHWLGGIMSLPGNVSSALLGSGDSTASNSLTGPNSTNNASVANTTNVTGDLSNKATISNHANLVATSGDANVSGNTTGGNASSGKASVLSSVANLTNTVVNVRKWFGILIINVFGAWTGSVGKDTAAGSAPDSVNTTTSTITGNPALAAAGQLASNSSAATTAGGSVTTSTIAAISPQNPVVGAATHNAAEATALAHDHSLAVFFLIAAGFMLAAGAMFSLERKLR